MFGFMDHVQAAWHDVTRWDPDSSYANLTATSRALLDFPTPSGLRLHVSSLSSPHLATSYTLGSVGLVDGSLSYLYSSAALAPSTFKSSTLHLPAVSRGYRHLRPLLPPDEAWRWEIWHRGKRIDRRDTLLYGRLYLPSTTLEALYLRRISPTQLLKLSCVSDSRLKNGGTILAHHTHTTPTTTIETLYSSDSALLGLRTLYNLPNDSESSSSSFSDSSPLSRTTTSTSSAEQTKTPTPTPTPSPPTSRLSTGCELYYGLLNSTIGLSGGLRYVSLPSTGAAGHSSIPLTATLTLNPLVGTLASTYAVQAGPLLSLAARFDFNVYSYESEVVLGCELWRPRRHARSGGGGGDGDGDGHEPDSVAWAVRKMERRPFVSASASAPTPTSTSTSTSPTATTVTYDQVIDTAAMTTTGTHSQLLSAAAASHPAPNERADNDKMQGVLKARVDQKGSVRLLWEGRVKELLFSLGTSFDVRSSRPFRAIGLELQYSS